MALELAWGRVRRAYLRLLRPGYVRRMEQARQGHCEQCPHKIIDPRDLKYYRNVCGYWFRPEDDRFRWRDHLRLARPGLVELLVLSVVMVVLIAGLIALLFVGVSAWVVGPVIAVLALVWLQGVLFFRDPKRTIPGDPAALVSPADGTITDIGEVEAPGFPGDRALRIGIFLSVFNVHVNRSPRRARVLRVRYFPGKFGHAGKPPAPRENEQLWVDLEDETLGVPLRVKQISGAVARRIVCALKPGDVVQPGERFGMIKFGSRTEVYLPVAVPVEVAVQVGQAVKGGATVLGWFR
jgi:phosphatidylserine decarboxylase